MSLNEGVWEILPETGDRRSEQGDLLWLWL